MKPLLAAVVSLAISSFAGLFLFLRSHSFAPLHARVEFLAAGPSLDPEPPASALAAVVRKA